MKVTVRFDSRLIRRPVRVYKLSSAGIRFEYRVKCSVGAAHAKMSEGVHCLNRACICRWKRRIGFCGPPAFAASVATFARRNEATGGLQLTATRERNATAVIANVRLICGPFISLCHCRVEKKRGRIHRVKVLENHTSNLGSAVRVTQSLMTSEPFAAKNIKTPL